MFMLFDDDLRLIIKSLKLHCDELFKAVQIQDDHDIAINFNVITKEVELIKYLIDNFPESITAKQSNSLEGFIFGYKNLQRRLKGISNNNADLENVRDEAKQTFEAKLDLLIDSFKL